MMSVNFLTPPRAPLQSRLAASRLVAGAAALVLVIGLAVWSWALSAHVAQLRSELSAVAEKAAALRQSQRPHMRASQLIRAAGAAIPPNVWLTDMAVAGDQVTFEGYAYSYPLIARFMTGLQHSGPVGTVVLAMSQRETRNGEEVVKFRITAGRTETRPAATSPAGRAP